MAARLAKYAGRSDVVVLALPRGGVPVAFEVAVALDLPMDVFLVRKLGVPGHEELAMGAVASGGEVFVNYDVVNRLRIGREMVESVAASESRELDRRRLAYRGGLPELDFRNCTVILVDDGLATGSTMRAAAAALRRQQPAQIVIAVPVAAAQTCEELGTEVDEIVCVATPEPFDAVGAWYGDFSQTTDSEVRELLSRRRGPDVRGCK